jgi:hypothetical protein
MSAAQQIATQIATNSKPFAIGAVAQAGRIRSEIAGAAAGFNFGDAIAAGGYVVLSLYALAFLANFGIGL